MQTWQVVHFLDDAARYLADRGLAEIGRLDAYDVLRLKSNEVRNMLSTAF